VNVHPTKQEIKFEDEKIVYAFVQAAVKHALAQFSITPTLDFELDASIQGLESIQKPFTEEKKAATTGGSIFQTFTEANQAHKVKRSEVNEDWTMTNTQPSSSFVSLTKQLMELDEKLNAPVQTTQLTTYQTPVVHFTHFTQLFGTYILAGTADKFLLIHQQAAHERIIYEKLSAAMEGKAVATQRSLFPASIEVTPADAVLLTELLPDLHQLGYTIESFGKSAFVIQGTPADIDTGNEKAAIEKLLEQYKHFNAELKLPKREMLLRTIAWQSAIKTGVSLSEKEMERLATDLFNCRQANASPSGRPTYVEFKKEQLEKMFMR
jgi:DNA mismatch repair protein MutL